MTIFFKLFKTKSQDGIIKSMLIGNQLWMAENLNVSTYRDGSPIYYVKTPEEWLKATNESKAAWCYLNDNTFWAKYGKLYNGFAVLNGHGLAPEGWHVASLLEWQTLVEYLGGSKVAAEKMMSIDGWSQAPGFIKGTNTSGLSIVGGGDRNGRGEFECFNIGADFWTSTPSGGLLEFWSIECDGTLRSRNDYLFVGRWVRCIKD